MDRFNKLNSYFVDKERKRLDAIAKDTKSGLPEMSPAEIRVSCLENGKHRQVVKEFLTATADMLREIYYYRRRRL